MKLNIVILAAGQGKRMNSQLPKVLHKIGNKPLLHHVLEMANQLNPTKLIIVYGHGGDQVKTAMNKEFANNNFIWALQDQQLGTGHALRCALPDLDGEAATLVLYGDVPLISLATLSLMLDQYENNVVMLTTNLSNPLGYGRIIRNIQGDILQIVEEKDATESERLIKEVNTGFFILPNMYLPKWLGDLSTKNSQGEYYLTDIIAMANDEEIQVVGINALNDYESMGVNNKLQLSDLECAYQLQQANKLLEQGATILDKHRINIRGNVYVGQDCIIDINCIFEGKVTLGNNITVGAGCILKNIVIGDGVIIKPYSIIEDAEIGANCQIGPYARIRPGTKLIGDAHIGNFVEIKNSTIGVGSKVNHLTYIGDAEIGEKVNVGAGSVTCNYDGRNKFKTIIEDNVFVGSGTMLVAPVTIHEGSIIGAGSVITKDTKANELTVARAKQVTVDGWVKQMR
jgi:bifunctional UDP-N-acetylglucosamine pyrophosphorylase / glucosamine-1-phosphate N-acetyltransferase